MRCKEHPKYQARRMPVKTVKYPDGCPTCWGIWEDAKTNKSRLVDTINVELDHAEARRLLRELTRARPVQALERLYQISNPKDRVEARALTSSLASIYAQLERLRMLLALAIKETT